MHDFERVIVGYHPQSEPDWVTGFGYREPKAWYVCRCCGRRFYADRGSWAMVQLMLEMGLAGEPCPADAHAVS